MPVGEIAKHHHVADQGQSVKHQIDRQEPAEPVRDGVLGLPGDGRIPGDQRAGMAGPDSAPDREQAEESAQPLGPARDQLNDRGRHRVGGTATAPRDSPTRVSSFGREVPFGDRRASGGSQGFATRTGALGSARAPPRASSCQVLRDLPLGKGIAAGEASGKATLKIDTSTQGPARGAASLPRAAHEQHDADGNRHESDLGTRQIAEPGGQLRIRSSAPTPRLSGSSGPPRSSWFSRREWRAIRGCRSTCHAPPRPAGGARRTEAPPARRSAPRTGPASGRRAARSGGPSTPSRGYRLRAAIRQVSGPGPRNHATSGSARRDQGGVQRVPIAAADHVDRGPLLELAGDPDELQPVLGRKDRPSDPQCVQHCRQHDNREQSAPADDQRRPPCPVLFYSRSDWRDARDPSPAGRIIEGALRPGQGQPRVLAGVALADCVGMLNLVSAMPGLVLLRGGAVGTSASGRPGTSSR